MPVARPARWTASIVIALITAIAILAPGSSGTGAEAASEQPLTGVPNRPEQAAQPACPASLGALHFKDGVMPTITESGGTGSYIFSCIYGTDNPNPGGSFLRNRARAIVRWSEQPPISAALKLRCGVDDQVFASDSAGRTDLTVLHSDTQMANARYDAEPEFVDLMAGLASALLAEVERTAVASNPEVFCPDAPAGFRLHLRPFDFETRDEIGLADYRCAYAPLDNDADGGLAIDANWGPAESARWPVFFCNADFTSSGPSGSSEFDDYLLVGDRAAAVRYSGASIEQSTAAVLAAEVLEVIRERGAACPGADVSDEETPTASPSSSPTPTATSTEEPGELCAPGGRVTDHRGRAVSDIRIELRYGGSVHQDTSTGLDGSYSLATIGSFPQGFEFDPALDEIEVVLVTSASAGFELAYGPRGDVATIRFGPILAADLADDRNCTVNFALDGIEGDPLYAPFTGPTSYEHWADLLVIHANVQNAWRFAGDVLGVQMDDNLPFTVFTFCTLETPGTNGLCDQPTEAFWRGTQSFELTPFDPYVAFAVTASDDNRNPDHPQNREYHEFGHALMSDAFDNQMPAVLGSGRAHGGLYETTSSSGAWTEGFAEFFGMMVARDADAEPLFYTYPFGRSAVSLEDDWKIWQRNGKAEEFAVAGLLLDFVDGDADYTQPHQVELDVDNWQVFENVGAGATEPPFVLAALVRNETPQAVSRVAVRIFLEGGRSEFGPAATSIPAGGEETVLVSVPAGLETSVSRVEVFILAAADDDPISVSVRELWDVIVAAPSTHPSGNGHIVDVSELYEALFAAFSGDRDGDGQDDVNEIFVRHGYFADIAGGLGNHAYDDGEDIGLSSYLGPGVSSGQPRQSSELIEVFRANIDTGAVPARALVQIVYGEPFEGRSHAYELTVDESGTIEVAVPPPDTAATVTVTLLADGHLPATVAVLDSADFWSRAEAAGFAPFLNFEAELQAGELFPSDDSSSISTALLAAIGGVVALVIVALIAWRMRARSAAGGTPD